MNIEVPSVPCPSAFRRLFLYFKIFGIVVLILLLHIPIAMTEGVLAEREGFQSRAVKEIADTWGHSQQVTGPVLVVPYAYKSKESHAKIQGSQVVMVEETVMAPAAAYFLPEKMDLNGSVEPETRHRGIYSVVVYSSKLHLSGEYRADFNAAGIAADRIDWDKAYLLFGVSDLRGIRAISPVRIGGGKETVFDSADSVNGAFLPLEAKTAMANGGPLTFGFDVSLQGSERLHFTPTGKDTLVSLRSPWREPSFTGAYLPVSHDLRNGFEAEWEISHFSRGFPQSWTDRVSSAFDVQRKLDDASFGVGFLRRADSYQMVDRAEKYGVLFFVSVFAVFFLFEITAALRIHPLQYALVGAGLCLFFLGFLALSEFLPAGWAYGIAAGACTALISLYAWSVLKTGGRTLVILGGLISTYSYLYFVLKSQDYALLAGTAVLFTSLALIMFCTRRLNWYEVDQLRSANADSATP